MAGGCRTYELRQCTEVFLVGHRDFIAFRIWKSRLTREDLIQHAPMSDIFRKWHFFQYHFGFYLRGREHSFASAIVDAC